MIGFEKLKQFAQVAFNEMEGDSPEDATLGACILICEVRMRNPDSTAFFVHSTDNRHWIQRALLNEAGQIMFMEVEDPD